MLQGLAEFARILNTYSNLLLVVVTIVYATLTFLMVREMRRTRELQTMVVEEMRRARERQFVPYISVAGGTATSTEVTFRFRNEGNSVALGIAVDFVNPVTPMGRNQLGREMSLPESRMWMGQRGALSPGDSFGLTVNQGASDRGTYVVQVTYRNVQGQRFGVRQPFEVNPVSPRLPGRILDVEFFVDGKQIVGAYGVLHLDAFVGVGTHGPVSSAGAGAPAT